jgi:hypothetical protein
VENWYDSMPRIKRAGKYDFRPSAHGGTGGGGIRIDSHFKSSHCVVCGLESATGMSTSVSAPDSSLTPILPYSTSHLSRSASPIPLDFSLTFQKFALNVLPTPLEHLTPSSPGPTSLNPA